MLHGVYSTTSFACQVTFDYDVIFLFPLKFFFMIWEVEFSKCLPSYEKQEAKEKKPKKRKRAIDFIHLFSINCSSFHFFFRSSVYLIVPNIYRHILYLFFLLSSIDPWNSISSNKDFFSSSSTVFLFLFTVKAFFKCICARQCRHHHHHLHLHCRVSQRWV